MGEKNKPIFLKYPGDLSYIKPVERFQEDGGCHCRKYNECKEPLLSEPIFQISYLTPLKDENILKFTDSLFNSGEKQEFLFLKEQQVRQQYKRVVLDSLASKSCLECKTRLGERFETARLSLKEVVDLSFSGRNRADEFAVCKFLCSFEGNRTTLTQYENKVTVDEKWFVVLLSLFGRNGTSYVNKYTLRPTVYIPSFIHDEHRFQLRDNAILLGQLKYFAGTIEDKLKKLLFQAKYITRISQVRDAFSFELFPVESFIPHTSIKKTKYYISCEDAENLEEFKIFSATHKYVKKEKYGYYSGLTTYTNVFSADDLKLGGSSIDEMVNKTKKKVYMKNTAQIERDKNGIKRVKFFFGARYLWREGEVSLAGIEDEKQRQTFGVRRDVDPVPDWIQQQIVSKLEDQQIISTGWSNFVAVNTYRDGKLGLGQHFDDMDRFDAPIVSVRYHSDCRLAFGCKFGYQNTAFYVPLLAGTVLLMEKDSFALLGIKHCVRNYDLSSVSSSVIIRRIKSDVFARAEKLAPWAPLCLSASMIPLVVLYKKRWIKCYLAENLETDYISGNFKGRFCLEEGEDKVFEFDEVGSLWTESQTKTTPQGKLFRLEGFHSYHFTKQAKKDRELGRNRKSSPKFEDYDSCSSISIVESEYSIVHRNSKRMKSSSNGASSVLLSFDYRFSSSIFEILYTHIKIQVDEGQFIHGRIKSHQFEVSPEMYQELETYIDAHPDVLENCEFVSDTRNVLKVMFTPGFCYVENVGVCFYSLTSSSRRTAWDNAVHPVAGDGSPLGELLAVAKGSETFIFRLRDPMKNVQTYEAELIEFSAADEVAKEVAFTFWVCSLRFLEGPGKGEYPREGKFLINNTAACNYPRHGADVVFSYTWTVDRTCF
eukprot:snap_masked-scaffold_14-processed-gene-1.25-mRNA-1 protein AED:1.00 eAED:1.00 QI:0/0/0/0/1/1/2/0/879